VGVACALRLRRLDRVPRPKNHHLFAFVWHVCFSTAGRML
jgi:hypothetical protein